MATFTEYLVDGLQAAAVIFHRDCFYRLDDGTLLCVEQGAAWCYRCGMIAATELIPSVEEIDARIVELDNPENIFHQFFGLAALERERHELPLRRAWRVSRRSPARCLECGSTDIFHINDEDCREPRFAHRIRETGSGFADMCFDITRRLSPEGVLISSNYPDVRNRS